MNYDKLFHEKEKFLRETLEERMKNMAFNSAIQLRSEASFFTAAEIIRLVALMNWFRLPFPVAMP